MKKVRNKIGKYKVGRTIGKGIFTKVKFAKNTDTKDSIAIKTMTKSIILKHRIVEEPENLLLDAFGNLKVSDFGLSVLRNAYRAFYILNWIYRYLTEPRFTLWIACVSGVVQTALYVDFFYYLPIKLNHISATAVQQVGNMKNFVLQLEEQFKTKVAYLN
ncbi:hypothetical protein AHAS_Ahas03G0098100 [Arachis hypogaea]